MIKKDINFEDFDGNTVTETHYFHLRKDELLDMEFSHEGGLSTTLPEMIKAEDKEQVWLLFKKLVQKAYGVRSEDGRRHIKDPETTKLFIESLAFEALFDEILGDENKAAEFFTGLMPKGMVSQAEVTGAVQQAKAEIPAGLKAPQDMTKEELLAAFQAKTSQPEQAV